MTSNDPSTNVPGQPSQGDATTNPPVQGTNPPSQGDQGTTSIEELQRKLAELERDNRKYRQERKQQEEAAALAAQKQLEEQGQYKALAEQHAARVQQLEPVQERYTELSGLIARQIDDEIKEWPKSVKALDPGKDAPIEQRLAWRNNARAIIADMQQQTRGGLPGNGPNPNPIQQTEAQQLKETMKRQRATGQYPSF
jgi:hypothetical protein